MTNKIEVNGKEFSLTKEFYRVGNDVPIARIVLSAYHKGQLLNFQMKLLELAQNDFPRANLTVENVASIVLEPHLWGIEFEARSTVVMPKDYEEINYPQSPLAGGLP